MAEAIILLGDLEPRQAERPLDLTHPQAREIVLKAVAGADVFLTSYLQPTRRKLGLDFDDVRTVNPSIVYGCGTGQGPRGEEADRGGYDSISFWARGGVATTVTPPESSGPLANRGERSEIR